MMRSACRRPPRWPSDRSPRCHRIGPGADCIRGGSLPAGRGAPAGGADRAPDAAPNRAFPDYRSPGRQAPRQPIEHDAFLRRPEVRRRYWARATLGWTSFSRAEPNRRPPGAGRAGTRRPPGGRDHPERGSAAPPGGQPAGGGVARGPGRRSLSGLRRRRAAAGPARSGWSRPTPAGWSGRRLPPTATPSCPRKTSPRFRVVACTCLRRRAEARRRVLRGQRGRAHAGRRQGAAGRGRSCCWWSARR